MLTTPMVGGHYSTVGDEETHCRRCWVRIRRSSSRFSSCGTGASSCPLARARAAHAHQQRQYPSDESSRLPRQFLRL